MMSAHQKNGHEHISITSDDGIESYRIERWYRVLDMSVTPGKIQCPPAYLKQLKS